MEQLFHATYLMIPRKYLKPFNYDQDFMGHVRKLGPASRYENRICWNFNKGKRHTQSILPEIMQPMHVGCGRDLHDKYEHAIICNMCTNM